MMKTTVKLGIRWMLGVAFIALTAVQVHASSLTYAEVKNSPYSGLIWNTQGDGYVVLFFKDGATFLNPNDEALNIDLSAPGVYSFDLRLNNPPAYDMTGYTLDLTFDNAALPQISVTGTRDTTGGTPSFSGTITHGSITLTDLRISSFNAVDEVGDWTAGADGYFDYIGSIELTVIPEPSSALLVGTSLFGALALRWRK